MLPWSYNLNIYFRECEGEKDYAPRNSSETIYVDWTKRLVSCFVGWATRKPYFSQYRHLRCSAEKSSDILFPREPRRHQCGWLTSACLSTAHSVVNWSLVCSTWDIQTTVYTPEASRRIGGLVETLYTDRSPYTDRNPRRDKQIRVVPYLVNSSRRNQI